MTIETTPLRPESIVERSAPGSRMGWWASGILLISLAGSAVVFQGAMTALSTAAVLVLALMIYASIRVLGAGPIESAMGGVLLFSAASLFGGFYAAATAILTLASLAILALKRRELGRVLSIDLEAIRSQGPWNLAFWLLAALLVSAAGMSFPKGFAVFDPIHPAYEHSIGQSFHHSILGAPDLSFIGKGIRFHPLSTQIPLFLSTAFGIPQLSAVYFTTPILMFAFLFLMVSAFFAAIPKWRAPVFILFFLPLLDLRPSSSDGFFFRTFVSPSFSLGTLLAVAAAYFLIKGNRPLLILAMAALLLAKASFFITFLAGISIHYFWKRDLRSFFIVGAANLAVFVSLYPVFLSKAHEHNLWLIGPFFLYENPTLPTTALWFLLAAVTLVSFFSSKKDEAQLALSSICLSGVLGTALLTEYTEGNAFQFMMAGFPFFPILCWRLPARLFPQAGPALRNSALAALCIMAVAAFAVTLRTRLIPMASAWHFKVMGTPLPTDAIPVFKPKDKINNPNFGADLIAAYTWLGRTPNESRILYGKHYEEKLDAYTGYVRSALSGRQIYSEGEKYKGIVMQPEYPGRMANALHFYRNFVVASPVSAGLMTPYYSEGFGREPGVPLSQSGDPILRKYHKMSAKKEWCWLNIAGKVEHEARTVRDGLPATPEWMDGFIREAGLDYIVLENGDAPSEALDALTDEAFATASVRILKVK